MTNIYLVYFNMIHSMMISCAHQNSEINAVQESPSAILDPVRIFLPELSAQFPSVAFEVLPALAEDLAGHLALGDVLEMYHVT